MTGPVTRLSRLPLRVRLVAGFSVATLVVLLAAGVFVYWRVEYALDRGLDAELSHAQETLAPLVDADGEMSNRPAADATGVAWQVLDREGTVLDHGGPAAPTAMVTQVQLARAGDGRRTYDVGGFLPASDRPYRVLVTRLPTSADRYLVVGVRRDHRDEALRELLLQLTLAGVGTLLVTALVGDRLARAALRPVERYRRRAAEIAAGDTELRLDVPPLRDDEVTRLGHTFNDMLATLDRALGRERLFVAEASHELRTPLTLLKSRVQLARRRPRTVEEHDRILAELDIDLARLARLADQLLDLGSGAPVSGSGGDLAAVAARVAGARSEAVVVPPTGLPVLLSDLELERILGNLLDNAAAHGEPPVRVTVDQPAPGWARLTVSDAGPGMPRELLASATQRFVRAEEARARPGAGLGLALVEALVARGGGELRLCHGAHASHGRSVPVGCDHGPEMTVTVLLPVVEGEIDVAPA